MRSIALPTIALLLTAPVSAQIWLDPSFGTGGLVDISLDAAYDGATAVAVQTDGRIVVAGSIVSGAVSSWDFLVARYEADGTLDTGFGTGGFTTHDWLDNDRARGVAIQADGRIVVVGTSTAGSADKVIMRFTADGLLDNTFNGNGVRVIDDSFSSDQLNAVAIQPDQKIVVAGQGFNGSKNMFYIARLNSDGTFDNTFAGGTGELEHTISGDNCKANAVAIMNDGRIVSAGISYTNATTTYDAAVVRYMPDGTFDTTFDGDGIAVVPWSAGYDNGLAVWVQSDNKVLVGGVQDDASPSTALAVTRLMVNGSPDTGFGVNATVHPYTGIPPTACGALAQDADGNILVGGTIAANANESQSYLCRLLPADGAMDPTFGASGELVQGAPFAQEETPALAIQSDGKIVLAGSLGGAALGNVRLIRYLNVPITGIEGPETSAFRINEADAAGLWFLSPRSGPIAYDLFDASGRSVARGNVIGADGVPIRITFEHPLPPGGYDLVLLIDRAPVRARFVVVR